MLRHIPNLISISRIILLFCLFPATGNRPLFFALYIACGLTDVLDGAIARRMHTESELGARLDSIADLLFFTAAAATIIMWQGEQLYPYVPWALLAAALRLANLIVAACKYRSLGMLHTWGNKLSGALLFVTPFFLLLDGELILIPLCAAAILSALEETAIHLTSTELNLNRKSIFSKR